MEMLYSFAMREVRAKVDNIYHSLSTQPERNPIQAITQRLKSTASIAEKLLRRHLPLDYAIMKRELHDIAGLRIICSYIGDLYDVAQLLLSHENIDLLQKKDYIIKPKKNGYRSLHLIVAVPVMLSGTKHMVPVEIQLRTIAMDFWASLEHQMRYKSDIAFPDTINYQLADLAETIYDADMEMQAIHLAVSHEQNSVCITDSQ